MSAEQRIAVIGTGMMGPGIAVSLALAGYPVRLYARTDESLARGLAGVTAALNLFVGGEVIDLPTAEAARGRVDGVTDLADHVRDVTVVFESIAEDLAVKQEMFKRLESLIADTTILASNTSGLTHTDIAQGMQRLAARSPRISGTRRTSCRSSTWSRASAPPTTPPSACAPYCSRAGKHPVIVNKDVAGQLGNRLLHAVIREATYMVQEGIASAEDVDAALKYGPGLRFPVYGPLEHSDVVGIDLTIAVHSKVVPALNSATRRVDLLYQLAEQGDMGVKSGRGFYDWTEHDAAAVKARRDNWLLQRLKERLAALAKITETGATP